MSNQNSVLDRLEARAAKRLDDLQNKIMLARIESANQSAARTLEILKELMSDENSDSDK